MERTFSARSFLQSIIIDGVHMREKELKSLEKRSATKVNPMIQKMNIFIQLNFKIEEDAEHKSLNELNRFIQ